MRMTFQKGNTYGHSSAGRVLTEEHKRKVKANNARAFKGRHHSEATKEKMRAAALASGRKPSFSGYKHSDETKKRMSIVAKGKKKPLMSLETRRKISEANKGAKNKFWRGGVYPIHRAIRCSFEYRLWREAVFKRDNWTCIWCLKRGGKLNADHIKSFAQFPELRFSIDNGRTLCEPCHRTTDNYGSKGHIK